MDARLEPYRVVVSFLGEALGPDYEVVLHRCTASAGGSFCLHQLLYFMISCNQRRDFYV